MITKHNKITVKDSSGFVGSLLPLQNRHPPCGGIRYVGEGMKFERIRRITGYLVGTLDRFNNAKRAEESQRVKHCGCLRDS